MNLDLAALLAGRTPRSLRALRLPDTLRLVVLTPHPDDFDAIAATMRFFKERGNRIDVAVATSGASGVESGFGGATTKGAKAALRELEQKASCRLFGLPEKRLSFLHLREDESGHPLDCPDNLQRVSSFMRNLRPDLVFLPHWHDPNQGHRRTHVFLLQIIKEDKLSLAVCLNQDPKTMAMRHDLYFGFGPDIATWKGEMLRLHQSQQQRNLHQRGHGFDERILGVNRKAAGTLGLREPYAEVFELEIYTRGTAAPRSLEKLNAEG